ncbi:MAG: phosphatidate cytidylyltransferase [Flavobacteriales bacterium]
MSNLVVRAIAGIVFSALVIGAILIGSWALGALFFLFSMLGLSEFYQMVAIKSNDRPRQVFGFVLGIGLYAMVMFQAMEIIEGWYFWLLAPIVILLYIAELIHLDKRAVDHVATTIMGLIYVVVPFSMINMLAFIQGEFNYELPLGFFIILWGNDTAAYFTGRLLGRTKLYEKVSPNKTWEGLIGGVAIAVLGGYFLSKAFDSLEANQWMIISAIIAIFGNLGDLFESHLKRSYGVKDSGNIIPGHGGVLDRFDGLLLALPIVIFYLKFFNHL